MAQKLSPVHCGTVHSMENILSLILISLKGGIIPLCLLWSGVITLILKILGDYQETMAGWIPAYHQADFLLIDLI